MAATMVAYSVKVFSALVFVTPLNGHSSCDQLVASWASGDRPSKDWASAGMLGGG